MNRVLGSFSHLAVILVAALVGLVITVGSCDRGPTRPGSGWCGLDTLYESRIPVRHTCDVRAAFEAYVAFVDTTAAQFPDEETWTYLGSRPFKIWHYRLYWEVDYEVHQTSHGKRVIRRLAYIDENGVIVRPLGCI